MGRFRKRLTSAHVIAVVALFFAIGGGALAATSGGAKISVCVQRQSGELYQSKTCRTGDSKLSWYRAGPRGRRGAKGPRGARGATGTDGTTIVDRARGSGPAVTSNSWQNSTLTGNSWTQAANELDTIVAKATVVVPSSSACNAQFVQDVSGRLLVNGNVVTTGTNFTSGPGTGTLVISTAYLFEPGTSTNNQITAQFEDNCGTNGPATQHYAVTNVVIDVEGAR